MGDGPEQEENTASTHQSTHVVHHLRHLGGVGSKL